MATQGNQFVDKVDRIIAKMADWSIRNRLLVALITTTFLLAGLYSASKVRLDNSYDAFFDKSDPAYLAYMEYLDDFQSDEVSYILYHAPEAKDGPFDIDVMRKIADLTELLESEVPFVRTATSLANVEFITAVEDDIVVDELLLEFPESQRELLDIRETVMSKPLYVDSLISKNRDYSAIILEMTLSSSDSAEAIVYDTEKSHTDLNNLYPQVSDHKIRELLSRPEFADIAFYLTGDVHMNTAYNEILGSDAALIMLATLSLIIILSFFLFRATLVGMAGPITVVLCSVIMTVGFVALLGWKLGAFFSMIPTMICAVGVAQSVHILLEFQRKRSEGNNKAAAAQAALKKVGGPCLMAALTTAAGFLVMSVSQLQAVSELAIYSAIGVMLTFFLSTTLLVCFLAGKDRQSEKVRETKLAINPLVNKIVQSSIALDLKSPNQIIAIWAAIFVFSFAGIAQLKIDFNFLEEFKPKVEWRKHTEKAESVMGGMLNIAYVVDTKVAEGVKDPAILAGIEKIQRFAESKPLVKKTYSVTDIIKDMNRTFNGDDRSFYKLPTEKDLTSQYFLMYEISGGEEIEDYVSHDFSRTVLEFRVEMTRASNVFALQQEIDAFISQNPIPNAEIKRTGMGLLWVKIAEYVADTQIVSYSLVFLMIAVFMSLTFGSVKVGLLSMVPNIAPVVITLGAMGWLAIPLDYMKMMLATIAIGIAVDDTIHLVTRYRRRYLESGNYQQALTQSLTDVGPALVITTIILVGAFSAYLYSSTTILASFGILLASAIVIALLADLFLMPVLLMKLKPFGEETSDSHSTSEQPAYSNSANH